MKRHEFAEELKKAFVPMPPEFAGCIEFAFERGEKEMKKRHKIMTLLSAAAVLTIAFAVGGLAVNELSGPKRDNVVLSAREENAYAPSPAFTPPQAEPEPEEISYELVEGSEAPNAEIESPEAVLVLDENAHFYEGEYNEPEALCVLLSNAYWAYAHQNDLDMDSRAVFAAANELENIYANSEDKAQMPSPIRDCLQSVLGFDEDFIARHYLVNDVIGCLYGAAESVYLEGNVLPEDEIHETAIYEQREEINAAAN